MVKTLIFDNNGVLVTSNEETGFPALQKIIGGQIKEFIPIYNELAHSVDEGLINTNQFFDEVVGRSGITIQPSELKRVLYGSFQRKEETIKIAQKYSKFYELAVLSNFGDSYWELNENWKIDDFIPNDKIILSYQLGCRKPQKRIYKKALTILQRKPKEVIFIDDNFEFVNAASKLGLNTILYKSPNKLEKQLQYLLKGING